jgi:hydrogenase nickel incorporation protein HypA/HybF
MHEVSLVDALFDRVDAAIGQRPRAAVREVTVRLGALAGVERALFQAAFEGLRALRGYDDATLRLDEEAACWRCEACGGEEHAADGPRCAACGEAMELVAGDAIVLLRIEVEEVHV